MEASLAGTRQRPSVRADLKAVSWWVMAGAAAGAIAGCLVGGIGGRLAMLLLRVTSPESVIGVISDDGFEIGVISTDTLNLVGSMTMLGAINGVLYAAVRSAIPARLRLPLWAAFAALFGGANFVHDDGVDFALLEPALLAILLFVALPGLAAALVVFLVERWSETTPWQNRRFAAGLVVATVASTFAILFALLVSVVALALGRSERLTGLVRHGGKFVVPAALAVAAIVSGVDVFRESGRILD
jgi:hypothetical protein